MPERHSRSEEDDADSSISEEERQEILREIESVAAQNKINLEDDPFRVTPIHKRAYFPLIVNIGAVVILAVGLFSLYQFFQAQERAVRREAGAVESGEARLIRQLQAESEQRIAAKEREIAGIQTRLAEIDEERRTIAESMEEQIRLREAQIRAEFERRVADEENRLAGEGLSDAQIRRRIADLQAAQAAELEAALAEAREATERERAQLEDNLESLRSEYDSALEAAREEQASLQAEADRRAQEIEAEYGAQLAETMEALDRLAADRDRESRVRNQVAGYYDAVRRDIESADYAGARETLQALRAYLFQPTVEQVASIAERRPTELFVIESLTELIRQEESDASVDTANLLAAARAIGEVNELAAEAAAAAAGGDAAAASALYARAIAALPAIEESHEFLLARGRQDAAKEARAQSQQELESAVADAREAAREDARRTAENERARLQDELGAEIEALTQRVGELRAELDRVGASAQAAEARAAEAETRAAIESTRADVAESRAENAAARADEAEAELRAQSRRIASLTDEIAERTAVVAALQDQIADLRTALSSMRRQQDEVSHRLDAVIAEMQSGAQRSDAETTAEGASVRLRSMLGTTVTLRRVLASEFVRSQYPNLYEETDEYFAALATEREERGRREILDELVAVVGALEEGEDPESIIDGVSVSDPQSFALMARLLSQMRGLITGVDEERR